MGEDAAAGGPRGRRRTRWSGSPDPVLRVLRVLVLVLWPTVFVWLLPGQHRPGGGAVLAVVLVVVYSAGALLLLGAGARTARVLPVSLGLFAVAAVVGGMVGAQPEMALVVPLFLSALGVVGAMRLDRRGTLGLVVLAALGGAVCVAYVADDPVRLVVGAAAVAAGVAAPPLAVVRLRAQLDAARAREHELARTDPLTGALNRRGLLEATRELCGTGAPVVVVVLDLDDFKALNDAHGHAVGDDVLVRVVAGLRQVGEDDLVGRPVVVGRLGGEEFVVLAPSTGMSVDVVAERVRRLAAATVPGGGTVTASVGALLCPPAPAPEEAEAWLLRHLDEADRLMYAAKRSGGDRVLVATS